MNTLNDFDDENPFEHEGHRVTSEESSTSRVAIYEPSPPHRPAQALSSVTRNTNRPPFPSTGSHKSQSVNYKTDFCCASDRFLHSGDDFEILVPTCLLLFQLILTHSYFYADCGRAEDIREFKFTLHRIRHSYRCQFPKYLVVGSTLLILSFRMLKFDTDIRNLKVFATNFPSYILLSLCHQFPQNKL